MTKCLIESQYKTVLDRSSIVRHIYLQFAKYSQSNMHDLELTH